MLISRLCISLLNLVLGACTERIYSSLQEHTDTAWAKDLKQKLAGRMQFLLAFYLAFSLVFGSGETTQIKCTETQNSQEVLPCNCTCKDGKDGKDGKNGVLTTEKYEALIKVIEDLQHKVKHLEKRNTRSSMRNFLVHLLHSKRLRSKLFNKARRARGFFDADFDPVRIFFGEDFLNHPIVTQPPRTAPQPTLPDLLAGVKDNAPQLNKDGKVPQKLLPAGYDRYSAADIQWQALHMSAAAACRSVSKEVGHPGIHNVVLLRNAAQGKSCRELCSNSWARNCQGEVSIWGKPGRGQKNGEEIGNYYNYGCDFGYNGGSESYAKDSDIGKKPLNGHQHFFSYCCCSFY